MINYIIITGTSRGLGEAISMNLIQPENHLFCISRSANSRLVEGAKNKGVSLDYFQRDLSESSKTEELFEKIFKKIDFDAVNSISLINNAGVLAPISVADKYNSEEVARNIDINLTAPILTTGLFIKNTNHLNIEKRIINISSGAANKAYHGWGPYCASKAGLNIFSKCVSLEQKTRKYPVKLFSVAPGVIDTEMQAGIRNTKKDDFVDLERFIAYKEDGKLMPPDSVAKKIIKLLTINKFESGEFIEIEELE
ncbi:MAG: (S)-benzoin forming benzil reductase [Candidatus Magasanikbacteria bacterium]